MNRRPSRRNAEPAARLSRCRRRQPGTDFQADVGGGPGAMWSSQFVAAVSRQPLSFSLPAPRGGENTAFPCSITRRVTKAPGSIKRAGSCFRGSCSPVFDTCRASRSMRRPKRQVADVVRILSRRAEGAIRPDTPDRHQEGLRAAHRGLLGIEGEDQPDAFCGTPGPYPASCRRERRQRRWRPRSVEASA